MISYKEFQQADSFSPRIVAALLNKTTVRIWQLARVEGKLKYTSDQGEKKETNLQIPKSQVAKAMTHFETDTLYFTDGARSFVVDGRGFRSNGTPNERTPDRKAASRKEKKAATSEKRSYTKRNADFWNNPEAVRAARPGRPSAEVTTTENNAL